MRPQNRPFVVEIKKTKRGGASASAGAPAAQPPATWAEQFEQATALTDSAARKAAEALFSAPRPSAPVPQRPARVDDGPSGPSGEIQASSSDAPGRTGRILVALSPDAQVEAPAPPAHIAKPASRVGRPRKVPADAPAPAPRPVAKARTEPLQAPRPAPAAAAAPPVFSAETAPLAPSPAASRKGIWRRGGETLARGEKWKRRLPQVLR